MQSSPRIEELRQKFHENPRRYFAPLANEYRKAGDPEQAIAICRAHLAQQPGHMSGHVVYGQALYDARRMDEAAVVFQQALALDPENVIVLRHLGDIARQRGDAEEARGWYSRALDGDPHDAEVAAYLAELTEPLVTTASEAEVTMPAAAAGDASPVAAEPEPQAEEASVAFDADDSPYLDVPASSRVVDDQALVDDFAQVDEPTQVDNLAEVDEPGPVDEPAPVDDLAAVPEEESPPEETERRPTPKTESTPIVTRTLAELYLEQGYIEPALEIYRQLAEREPEDPAIRERISELAGDETSEEALSAEPADAAANKAGLMEEAAGAGEVGDRSTGVLEGESVPNVTAEEHFTEAELSAELWDTADSWGADLFVDDADEFFRLRVDVAEVGPEPVSAEPPTETSADTYAGAYAEPEADIESATEAREADQSDRLWGETAHVTRSSDTESEPVADEPVIATGASLDDTIFADEMMRSVTVREFFATLGSVRPPSPQADQRLGSEPTSEPNAAEPEASIAPSPAPSEGYAFAADAFASLFADSPANAEDSRAAAALSGAVAHGAPFLSPAGSAAPPTPDSAGAREARVETTRESEEDIRRFREWLDGLAES